MNQLKDLDIIALTEDISATHFETGEPITLYTVSYTHLTLPTKA